MEQLWCHYSTMVDYDVTLVDYGATTMVDATMVPLWWTMVDATMVALDLDLDHLPRSLAEQDDHCATFVQFCCSRTLRGRCLSQLLWR